MRFQKFKLYIALVITLFIFSGCTSIYTHCVFNSLDIKKIDGYLYTVSYNDYNYKIAESAVSGVVSSYIPGACSGARKGDYIGRNYDWFYDDEATFVVRTPATNGRHATLSISSLPFITDKEASEKTFSEYYTLLPFIVLDGINDSGLVCQMNIIPGDDNVITTGTNPGKTNMFELFLPRFILDYSSTVEEAIELLDKVNIYALRIPGLADYEIHLMISDSNKTVAVEFIDNSIKVVPCEVITNFFLYNYDGTRESLSLHSQGIERYYILKNGIDSVLQQQDMVNLMKSVRFSQYLDINRPVFWYSDYAGISDEFGDLNKNNIGEISLNGDISKAGVYAKAVENEISNYKKGKRDSSTWHTLHTSVYTISNRSLTLLIQEQNKQYTFNL